MCQKKRWSLIESFLNRLFFQIFFTLESIKLVFPDYAHNDLFIRNILVMKTNYQHDQYIRYNYRKYTFDLPASGLYIKLNDFGMNVLNKNDTGIIFQSFMMFIMEEISVGQVYTR
jgi:hypothetical protein